MSSSATCSKGVIQAPEESGWTQYLQDFSSEPRENSEYSYDDAHSFGSPSLVSDAASPAYNGAWNFSGNGQFFACDAVSGTARRFPKTLKMKKQPRQGYSSDDLEDTASSPVNSPKVSDLKHTEMSCRRKDVGGVRCFQENDGVSDQVSYQRAEESSRINLDVEKIKYEDLKKRGLCLMPFSMLVQYTG